MKHKLIACIMLFISFNAFSQDYKVTWSEEVKGDKLPQFATANSKREIITIGVKKLGSSIKKLKVKKYDKNLRLLETIEQKEWESNSWKAGDYIIDGMINVGEKIYCILYKKENKQYLVYKNELTKDLRASDKLEQIGVFNHTGSKFNFSATSIDKLIVQSENNKIRYNVSNDKSKFILYNYFENDNQKHITIYCFNKNFEKLWSKNISLKLSHRDIDVKNTLISDKGNVYINYEKATKKGFFGGTLDYESNILQISDNGEKIKNIDLAFDKNIHVSKLYIDNNEYTQTLNAMGFYSNNKSRPSFNGIVNVVINENSLELETKNNAKFEYNESKLFNKDIKSDKNSKKDDPTVPNSLTLIGQYAMSDGGTIYVSEIYKIVAHNVGKSTFYYHYYGDIMINKTNYDGDIEWTKIIKRLQGPFSENYLQYLGSYSFVLDDKIYLMYNDDQSNIESQENSGDIKRTKKIKKAMAVLKIIDIDGNIKSDIILDGKEEDVIFNTSHSLKLNDQQLLLFANKKKLTKVGSLFVKELDEPLKYKPSKVKASETATKPEGLLEKNSEKPTDIQKVTETGAPLDVNTAATPKIVGTSATPSVPEAKTPPVEAPKPVYTPTSVSPGRKATDEELDFFNKLRGQQPAAEPSK